MWVIGINTFLILIYLYWLKSSHGRMNWRIVLWESFARLPFGFVGYIAFSFSDRGG